MSRDGRHLVCFNNLVTGDYFNQVLQNSYAGHSEELWHSPYDVNIGTIGTSLIAHLFYPKKQVFEPLLLWWM